MKLSGVIWLEEIVEKIERKHHVTQNEVREILRNSSHFRFVEKGHGEERMFIRYWARQALAVI